MSGHVTDWCILRCSNCKTLELAASLTDAGFEAWSPAETISRRARSGNKREEVRKPLVASFVFARANRMDDLLALSHSPTLNYRVWDSALRRMVVRGHPYFRVSQLRLVPDGQLSNLRAIEHKRRPKGKPRAFEIGTVVRITEGGFEGLIGLVEECRGDYATVTLDDWSAPAKIATWLLHPILDDPRMVHVSGHSSEPASLAKAA
jgi:transcription antitermination factor NusG